MAPHRSFKRKHAGPRVVRPGREPEPVARGSSRRLVVALGVLVGVLGASSALAYREVSRAPDPAAIPADPALIPDTVSEPVSEFFPRHTALYGRLALDAGIVRLLRGAASGTTAGMHASLRSLERFVPMGLYAMTGYPGGTEEDPAAGAPGINGSPVTPLVRALVEQLDREVAVGLFPGFGSSDPVGFTVVAGIKDPTHVRSLLYEARRQFPWATALDRVHLDGERMWFSSSALGFSGLARDGHFKRAMAGLPEDRFGTAYVDAASLQTVATACGIAVESGSAPRGGEVGAAIALFNDPEVRSFLADLEREGGMRQHVSLATTNRLGLVQTFTRSDWQPRDPEAFRRRVSSLTSRLLSSSLKELQSLSHPVGS